MSILHKIRKSKYHLLFSVLPIVFLAGVIKIVSHLLGWEVIPKELLNTTVADIPSQMKSAWMFWITFRKNLKENKVIKI